MVLPRTVHEKTKGSLWASPVLQSLGNGFHRHIATKLVGDLWWFQVLSEKLRSCFPPQIDPNRTTIPMEQHFFGWVGNVRNSSNHWIWQPLAGSWRSWDTLASWWWSSWHSSFAWRSWSCLSSFRFCSTSCHSKWRMWYVPRHPSVVTAQIKQEEPGKPPKKNRPVYVESILDPWSILKPSIPTQGWHQESGQCMHGYLWKLWAKSWAPWDIW